MCIFCKIVSGEIPSYKVYDDNDIMAFLDISQATYGHTLIIPKKHYSNILELDEEISGKIFKVAVSLSKKINKNLKAENMNIINNCGKVAGQTVEHFHIHILPRYEDDKVTITYPTNKLNDLEFKELVKKIRS